MLKDLSGLALSNLLRRKLRSYLTIIGVVIGITAVVALIGLGEGLNTFITGQFGLLGADTITIQAAGTGFGPPGAGAVNPLTTQELDRIKNIRGVGEAFGRVIESGEVRFNDEVDLSYIGSAPEGEDLDAFYDRINIEVQEGRLLRNGDRGKIIVGSEFGTEEQFGKPVQVGNKLIIEGQSYDVIGILEKKGSFITDTTILMMESDVRDLFDLGNDEIDAIAVGAAEGEDVNEVVERIERELRNERNLDEGEEDFTVQTSQQALQSLEQTLFAVQLFFYIIAGVSILVGGVGITNTMYTSVLERTKEIGTMKAIGAQNQDIFTVFTIESGFIGLLGGIIGSTLGVIFSHGAAFIGRTTTGLDLIQATTSPWLIFGALAFSFIIGTLAGILPAINASKLNPVDALRKMTTSTTLSKIRLHLKTYRDLFKYSISNLAHRKLRSGLMVLSIFIGVMAVFALMSFGRGLSSYVDTLAEDMGKDNLLVIPKTLGPPGLGDTSFDESDIEFLRNINGVAEAAPLSVDSALVTFRRDTTPFITFVIGIPTGPEKKTRRPDHHRRHRSGQRPQTRRSAQGHRRAPLFRT
ncbi:MAG: ABC transporter permease [Nitrosarchaeum sp.]|nr:ABC transporter permease [Nitrosarchaeum sp.]